MPRETLSCSEQAGGHEAQENEARAGSVTESYLQNEDDGRVDGSGNVLRSSEASTDKWQHSNIVNPSPCKPYGLAILKGSTKLVRVFHTSLTESTFKSGVFEW